MSNFSKTLRSEPIAILSKEPSQPLALVKSYLDEALALYRENGGDTKPELDAIITDGLDANQVWWQVKMIIDNIGCDLLEKIRFLGNQIKGNYLEGNESISLLDGGSLGPVSGESPSIGSKSSDKWPKEENEKEEQESEKENHDGEGVQEIERYEKGGSRTESSTIRKNEQEEEQDLDDYGKGNEPPSKGPIDEIDYPNSVNGAVNDEFFDLDEFNRQTLEAEEHNDERDDRGEDDEEFDYFGDVPSEEEEEALYYSDFFDEPHPRKSKQRTITNEEKPKRKQQERPGLTEEDYDNALSSAKLDLFADDDEESIAEKETDAGNKLSTFEKQQLNIEKQIEQLEEEAITEKKWTLKGEVQSKDRPQDALLEEDVEFERTSKPVPIITAEVTESLEAMIRRRIKEKDFDDLPRRVLTSADWRNKDPGFHLSDQKSSRSLAELYEDDYKGSSQDALLTEELRKEHDEISDIFDSLLYRLDSLCSAHFIPKRPKKSLEVRIEAPALSMEDPQPLVMSSEQSLAPQEIYKVGEGEKYNHNEIKLKNGMPVTKDELTRDDKQRLRRAMKRKKAKKPIGGNQEKKKSKRDSTISTLSRAKNVTVINRKGEKHDIRGNVKIAKEAGNIGVIKL